VPIDDVAAVLQVRFNLAEQPVLVHDPRLKLVVVALKTALVLGDLVDGDVAQFGSFS